MKIKLHDIDGAQVRLHIRQGKGGKDRCVPVSARAIWKTHRNPVWLFPAPGCA